MILQERIKNIPIILGSKSPRRKELLSSMDLAFTIEIRETDESFDESLDPISAVKFIAETKLDAFDDYGLYDKLIICADTVVVDHVGTVIGKPKDENEAIDVISGLSGKEHKVYTAVAISYQGKRISFVEETIVWFNELSDEEIKYYVMNYKPMDKAGSYGIQEWIGRVGIERIVGSYENVIGLPTARLQKELKKLFL
ncbi:Maf family protein [Sphingobacterium daejeonense]|uniref:Maf family nucleotide pyrophosphatase n=1 Tax=Sphingobacterium daejeonense TaxID=371142 RepID=UPI0021A5049C|nr:Maf family protein [Sphingobacterium daejeonense]MCT1529534.1 Maf family protein [Sphingobacterium daejeonense]